LGALVVASPINDAKTNTTRNESTESFVRTIPNGEKNRKTRSLFTRRRAGRPEY
jgi:hypothetical protein